jgi:hypothetical protein
MKPIATMTLLALLCATGCGHKSRQARQGSGARQTVARASSSLEKWGIQPVTLRPTLGGTMLDFRFKVVNAEKARPIFDRKLKPYLLDGKTGVALGVPEDDKLGALRASMRNPPLAGKMYYVLFSNGYGTVRRGSKVTIVMGECKLTDVKVD